MELIKSTLRTETFDTPNGTIEFIVMTDTYGFPHNGKVFTKETRRLIYSNVVIVEGE